MKNILMKTFMLSLAVLLIAGCSNLFLPPSQPDLPQNGVLISISNDIDFARTLYPGANFSFYTLQFESVSGGTYENKQLDASNPSILITDLPDGVWTITAAGWVQIGINYYPSADGSRTITVTQGTFQSVSIDINPSIAPHGQDGFFSYSVDWPSTYTLESAGLWFYQFGEPKPENPTVNLLIGASGTLEVRPGYYVMLVQAVNNNDTMASEMSIVHIYSYFETEANINFTANNFLCMYEGKLLIFQAYGSNDGAAGVSHSFVELYNANDKALSLNNIFLHYADGVRGLGITADTDWQAIELSGTIPARGSFLIVGDLESTTARYQMPNNYGDINDPAFTLGNRSFKVALVRGTAMLDVPNPFDIDGNGTKVAGYIDMVGSANNRTSATDPDNIFGYETEPTRNSASEAVRRKNLVDTNNNNADFIAARYAADGFTNEELEVRRPRNTLAGSWDPFMAPGDPPPPPESEKLMILQANTHGNNNGGNAGFAKSLVEIYNNTDADINLTEGWYYLHIGDNIDWTNVFRLEGIIQSKRSFLVVSNSSATNATPRATLPVADQEENFELSNSGFKIAILRNQPSVLSFPNPFTETSLGTDYIDMLGAGNTTNGFETAAASASRPQGPRRTILYDTDNNSVDFATVDYRGIATGTNGMPDSELYKYWPRSTAMGPWNPVTGLPELAPGTIVVPDKADLDFSQNSGLYQNPFALTLATTTAGATIYYTLDGSDPNPAMVGSGTYLYTGPINVVDRYGQPNYLAGTGIIEQFYMAQNDPRGNIPAIFLPSNNAVTKATVVRAVAVTTSGVQSDVITNTYFIGNNLARYGNNPVISIVTDPKNLIDQDIGIAVRGAEINRWDPSGPMYNFRHKGRAWEREATVTFFDGNNNVAFSHGAGLRVRGGYSRGVGQKSWNIYFRSEYGTDMLTNYRLFPDAYRADGTPIMRHKNFMLRNGGNDFEYTKYYDTLFQSLVKDRAFTSQSGLPAFVYLNGEFWGLYTLQERYSDYYLENKFRVNRNNLVIIEPDGLDEGVDSDFVAYNNLFNDLVNRDMSQQSNYEYFCSVFDINNYIDYYAAQLYIYNEDWPHNNFQLWRVRNPALEGDNPYGDGKWRWQLYDTEFAAGIYNAGSTKGQGNVDAFTRLINGPYAGNRNNRLFINLLQNEEFSRRFVITMMDLYNVNFEYNSTAEKITAAADLYRPLMQLYFERWGYANGGTWTSVFENKTNDLYTYFWNIRDAMTNEMLPERFAHIGITADSLKNVTLSAEFSNVPVSNIVMRINTTTADTSGGSWTGQYYSALPVRVKAIAPTGFNFIGWEVSGGSYTNVGDGWIEVVFSDDVSIKAVYDGGAGVTIRTAFTQNSNLIVASPAAVTAGSSFIADITDNNTYTHTPVKSYMWYVNGVQISTQTGSSAMLPTTGLTAGNSYSATAIVVIDGAYFSQVFAFRVQ